MKELIEIQTKLKAPKSQFNKFGKYNYRSLEDIVEALKPLMAETKTFLTLSDRMEVVGNSVYLVAKATLHSEDGANTISVDGWAKEALDQKGMQPAQITGSTSTYARKYALNGLFAIDDTKDADSMDNSKENRPTASKATDADFNNIWNEFSSICTQFGVDANNFLGSQIDLTDKKLAHNTMIKWLKSGQQLQDQLVIFKGE